MLDGRAGALGVEIVAAGVVDRLPETGHLGDGLEQMLRGWNGRVAAAAGLPEGRLAESFAVTRING